jgi:hypothetical protein
MTARNQHSALRNLQGTRESPHQFLVRRAFDGRRSQAHAQRAVVLTDNLCPRGSGHDAHREQERVFALRVSNHPALQLAEGRGQVYQRPSNGLLQQLQDEQHDHRRNIEHADRWNETASRA